MSADDAGELFRDRRLLNSHFPLPRLDGLDLISLNPHITTR